MKKSDIILQVIFIAVIMFVFIMFAYKVNRSHKEEESHKYAMSTIVVDISDATDTVTIRDFNGNLWQFKGVEDWALDDICACVMDDNGTAEIKDDEIISVRYSGYIGGK